MNVFSFLFLVKILTIYNCIYQYYTFRLLYVYLQFSFNLFLSSRCSNILHGFKYVPMYKLFLFSVSFFIQCKKMKTKIKSEKNRITRDFSKKKDMKKS